MRICLASGGILLEADQSNSVKGIYTGGEMNKVSSKVSWEVIKRTLLPVIVLLLCAFGYLYYRIKIFPGLSLNLHQNLQKYMLSVFVLCIVFIVHRIAGAILIWYKQNIALKTKTKLDDQLVPIVGRSVKVLIWVVGILVILPFYGININALIAALGVGSLAIALAAQDTIANIIAGFLIMIDAPFRIGDKIKLPTGEVVEVLDIGVRRSKFLGEDNSIIIVPNVDLSKSRIINYTYGEHPSHGL